jgi:hypothetical protein
VAAALVVRSTGWLPIDPIASVVTTLIVVRSAWRLVRESVDVLLESAPRHIPLVAVRERLQAVAGVESVHDLHVWSVSSGLVAMSAHAVVPDLGRHESALAQIHAAMGELGIGHVTVQLERAAIAACAGRLGTRVGVPGGAFAGARERDAGCVSGVEGAPAARPAGPRALTTPPPPCRSSTASSPRSPPTMPTPWSSPTASRRPSSPPGCGGRSRGRR